MSYDGQLFSSHCIFCESSGFLSILILPCVGRGGSEGKTTAMFGGVMAGELA